ncbi:MAG: hypothetical protein BWY17_05220 [Deltaproteobacteria bacterium ADurb.Bin207]|nr:MAG: hypothetical protein BWY17_05220 [Deltaproteobacteria bacterium ADurb.Bin207]
MVAAPSRRHDDALESRLMGEHDGVGIQEGFESGGHSIGADKYASEHRKHCKGLYTKARGIGQGRSKKPSSEQGNDRIENAESNSGVDHAKGGQKNEYKQNSSEKGADIVEGQRASDQIFELHTTSQQSDEQRDFQTNESAFEKDDGVKNDTKITCFRKREKKRWSGESSDNRKRKLDFDESSGDLLFDEFGQIGSHTQGGEKHADHQGILCDSTSEQVARNGAGDELIHQTAKSHQQDGQVCEKRQHDVRRWDVSRALFSTAPATTVGGRTANARRRVTRLPHTHEYAEERKDNEDNDHPCDRGHAASARRR